MAETGLRGVRFPGSNGGLGAMTLPPDEEEPVSQPEQPSLISRLLSLVPSYDSTVRGLESAKPYIVPENPVAFGLNMLPMGKMGAPTPRPPALGNPMSAPVATRAEPDIADRVTQWLRDNPLPAPRNPREAAQLSAMRATDQMRRQMGVTANTEHGRSLDELLRTLDEAIKGSPK